MPIDHDLGETSLLQPAASPVNTFVDAPTPPSDPSGLLALADQLGSLNSAARRVGRPAETEAGRGGYGPRRGRLLQRQPDGLCRRGAQGLVPAQNSPAFMRAYKNQQGHDRRAAHGRAIRAGVRPWDGKTSGDLGQFDTFFQNYVKTNLGSTQDPEVLRGLMPGITAMHQAFEDKFVQRQLRCPAQLDGQRPRGDGLAGRIDTADTIGLLSDRRTTARCTGRTTTGSSTRSSPQRDSMLKVGAIKDDIDKATVDTIINKAIEKRDPKLLDLLDRPDTR